MTERELMLAVVEAARAIFTAVEHRANMEGGDYGDDIGPSAIAMEHALSALDAHTPEPEGEVVTMGLIRSRQSGRFSGTMEPDQEDPRDWEHVANITFRAPSLPRIPEIPATVERKP